MGQDDRTISSISGEGVTGSEAARFDERYRRRMAARRELPAPAAGPAALVPGALYGTDGANLYLIDPATGAAALIGPHGPVEFAIGAIAFSDSGILYGISLTSTARLYTIDVTTGAATAVGPLGIGFIFEGGLTFDASGRLLGVDQGDAATATTFTIDTATGAATILGPPSGQPRDLNGLTRAGDIVYGIDRPTDSLGRLSVATGDYTVIGGTGVPVGDTGGLAYRSTDGTLYATFEADGGFYRIDPVTGAATLIAVNRVDHGLAFAPADEPGELTSYSVKFVCGVQQETEPVRTVLRPGEYATEINVHNPNNRPVRIRKYLLPLVVKDTVIGREPEFSRIWARDEITLPPDTATLDDCYRIGELLYGTPPPQPLPLTVGFLELVSNAPVIVDVVYTANVPDGRTLTMDVERVPGRPKEMRRD
nr:hypothetical protein [Micromonospora sp. DSM 115978]